MAKHSGGFYPAHLLDTNYEHPYSNSVAATRIELIAASDMAEKDGNNEQYDHPSVTVDVMIFRLVDTSLEVLLIQRRDPPFADQWAFPGGFIKMNESLDDAALRELREETSVTGISIDQLRAFGEPNRDPRGRVISVAYLALMPPGEIKIKAGDDAAQVQWFAVSSVPHLAFDHAAILDVALQRLRLQTEYGDAPFKLLSHEFTLSQLQSAYEVILGKHLDKRNFRRKVLLANLLRSTARRRGGEGRPAELFTYVGWGKSNLHPRLLMP